MHIYFPGCGSVHEVEDSHRVSRRTTPQYSKPNNAVDKVLKRGDLRPAPSAERSTKEHSAKGMAILPPETKAHSGRAMQHAVTRFTTHCGLAGLPSFTSTAVTKPKYSSAAWHTKNSMKQRYKTPPWTTSVAPMAPITSPATTRLARGGRWTPVLCTSSLGALCVVLKCNGTELSALATTVEGNVHLSSRLRRVCCVKTVACCRIGAKPARAGLCRMALGNVDAIWRQNTNKRSSRTLEVSLNSTADSCPLARTVHRLGG